MIYMIYKKIFGNATYYIGPAIVTVTVTVTVTCHDNIIYK